MDAKYMVILIILFVSALIIGLDTWNRIKLRRRVKQEWGKFPRQPRFDKEESLKKAWMVEKDFYPHDSEIDDITWYDLDLFEVFEMINSTYSSVGSEALYQQLRNFQFKPDRQLTALIDFFAANPKIREDTQYTFAQLGKLDNNFSKNYLASGKKESIGNLPVFILLGCLPIVGLILIAFGFLPGIAVILISVLFNTVYYSIKKATLETDRKSVV